MASLKHLAVEREVGHDLLQPCVLVLESLQSPHLIGQKPCILLLPSEVGGLADPGLTKDLSGRCSFLALFQNERLLCVRKLVAFMPIPLRRENSPPDCFLILLSLPAKEAYRKTPNSNGPVSGDKIMPSL